MPELPNGALAEVDESTLRDLRGYNTDSLGRFVGVVPYQSVTSTGTEVTKDGG